MPWRSGYGHLARVFDCSFSPSGGHVLTSSEDATARVWRVNEKSIEQAACLTGHSAEVLRASWKQDETLIATGSADQTARIWKLQDEYGSECVSVLGGHSEELYCSEWVRGFDHHLLTASGRSVATWDTVTAKKISETELVSSSVFEDMPSVWRDLALFGCEQSPTDPFAACPCSDGTVHIVSLQGGAVKQLRCVNVAQDLEEAAMCMSAGFSTDGKQLAVATSSCVVAVYCTSTWKVLSQLDLDQTARSCCWHNMDGKQQLYVAAGASVLRYDPASGAASAAHSRWPSRTLLAVDVSNCSTSLSHKSIVACGEAVPDHDSPHAQGHNFNAELRAAPENSPGTGGGGASAPQDVPPGTPGSAVGESDVFFNHTPENDALGRGSAGRVVAGRRRGRGRRRSGRHLRGGMHCAGGGLGGEVPDAVGRAPLEVWGPEEFQGCE